MSKIIGLTGGIATGKSTVSQYLKEKNIPIVDGDVIARRIMHAGSPTVKKITAEFGDEYLTVDGEINRKKLGKLVFSSPKARKKLDSIVQTKIQEQIDFETEELVKENHSIIVLDIPLLFEYGYEKKVDQTIVVYVDEATQKQRLMKRNKHLSETDAINRINSQLPLMEKVKHADIVFDNTKTKANTFQQVDSWLEELTKKL